MRGRSAPAARLFLFPHAGGGASAFRDWRTGFAAEVELCAVQLPGREDRFSEPPFRRLAPLADALAAAIAPLLDVPFAFFGHSMGAPIAFELARRLRDGGAPEPRFLALSAYRAPSRAPRTAYLHALADDELIGALHDIGGMPPAMLQMPELLDVYLNVIRADFELCETWVPPDAPPLGCEILALGGRDDPLLDCASLEEWRRHTAGAFSAARLPGGHFYTVASRGELVTLLASRLAAATGAPAAGACEAPW